MESQFVKDEQGKIDSIVKLIGETPYFSRVSESLLRDVISTASILELEPEDLLILQGDKSDRMVYILVEGAFKVVRDSLFILDIDKPGMTIGEMAVISPDTPRSADVIATENSVVIAIESGFLDENTPESLKLANSFLKMFSNILSEKLRITTDRAKLYEETVLEKEESNKYNREITELSIDLKRELQLKLEQIKLYSQVVECNQDTIVISDENGWLQSGNQAFFSLFGYNKDEIFFLNVRQLFPDLQIDELHLDQQYQGEGWKGQQNASRKDKSRFPALISISPVRTIQENDEERVVYAMVVRDITVQREYEKDILKANEELKQTYQELELTLAELEKSNQVKDQFLSNITSQLKTPLVSMVNYAELLEKDWNVQFHSAEAYDLLINIIRDGKKMDQMVGNLLSLAEVSQGFTFLEPQKIEFSNLLSYVQERLEDNGNVIFEIDKRITAIVADQEKLVQAFVEIIQYAIYAQNESKKIVVRFSLLEEKELFEVTIFPEGYTPSGLGTNTFGEVSDGIELTFQKGELVFPYVKRIIDIHRGEMRIQGEGDQEWILLRIPLDPTGETDSLTKVMIIDEHEWDRKLLRGIIEKQFQGNDVFEFDSQVSALNALNAIKPNLVIVDPSFLEPQWEFIPYLKKLLRGNREKFSTLVISEMLTDIDMRNQVISLGITDFLIKPFTLEDALFKIKSIIETKQRFHFLSDTVHKAEMSAAKDGMTGLYNRKYFDHFIEDHLIRADVQKTKLSLIMTDVDHFKHYNDTNGHQLGDDVLINVAKILKGGVRRTDIAARYGGEEFVVVLPGATKQMATKIAEKLRKQIEEKNFINQKAQPKGNLTASFGVASFPENGSTPEDILKAADQCLYLAKERGRNIVVTAEE